MLQTLLSVIFIPLCLLTLVLGYLVWKRPWHIPVVEDESASARDTNPTVVGDSRQLVEDMLNVLSGRVEVQARDARQYGQVLEQHRDALQKAQSMRSIREVEQLLLGEVDAMRRANESYRQQLDTANRTINEQKQRLEKLTLDATLDFLTQVPNRRAFDKRLREEIERFRRGGPPFCLALLDIDHFKRINDTHGHPIGDEVLRKTARLLDKNRRITDFVARFGGEEFALLLPGSNDHTAAALVDRIRELTGELRFSAASSAEPFGISFSAGIAEMLPADQGTATLIQRADERLYRAKHSGRNRVVAS